MKKLMTGLLALTLIATATQAQDQKAKKHDRKHHDKAMMAEKLNLTADQKKRFQDVNADYKKQMADLKMNESITVKEMKERKETIRKNHKQQVESILNTEQKAEAAKLRSESKAGAKGKHGRKNGADRKKGMESMEKELNLSSDQTAKLKTSREAFLVKAKEIRSSQSLTDAEKKAQFKTLAEQQKAEMKSILTKEQQEKLEQKSKGKRERVTR